MNCRLLSTVLLSNVYRSGRHKFKTASMHRSPRSCNEAWNLELEIAQNSTDLEQQEDFSDQSCSSSSVSYSSSQKQENLIDPATAVPDGGQHLSKRALKRVRFSPALYFIWQCYAYSKYKVQNHPCIKLGDLGLY